MTRHPKEPELTVTEVDEIPPPQRGPRKSPMLDAYHRARASRTGKVRYEGEAEALDRFYRSMVQWRRRHKDLKLGIRKDGMTAVYIWVDR